LDWNTDHPHTNFRPFFDKLREVGYFVEVSGRSLTCVDLSNYGTLIVIDPEEEYFPEEINQIQNAVKNGLNLIAVADWFNEKLIEKIHFDDPNTKEKLWYPETGGANVPALNELLGVFGFAFGGQVLEGSALLLGHEVKIASGTSLHTVPQSAWVSTAELTDIAAEVLNKTKLVVEKQIFVIDYPSKSSGFVAAFGDSTCVEIGSCIPILLDVLAITHERIEHIGLSKVGIPLFINFLTLMF
jgi:membrane-bound transcription factor site-1 protease